MKKKIKESLGELKQKVTTANKIAVPEHKIEVIERSELEAIKEYEQDLDYGKRLRQFAALNKTNPDDLFSWLMDNYGKKPKAGKEAKNDQKEVSQKPDRPDRSNFAAELRRTKCGLGSIKPKKEENKES